MVWSGGGVSESDRSAHGPDELLDKPAQGLQRHGAAPEYDVMEGAEVEPRAEALLRVGPQPPDLKLTDLVGESLAQPCDVAVHLIHDVVLRERRVREHEVDRLFPGP